MSMKHVLFSLAAALGLLTAAIPATAVALQAPVAHYSTAMTELYGQSGPYTGALELSINAAGIVNGYYFPSDYSSMFVPVVGGKTGDIIWFDIGSTSITHVDGRLKGGIIVGTAFTSDNTQYTFVAKPTTQSVR
jgi:hypothetical protein